MIKDRWSERVIGACIAVHRVLGVGFKEVTYGNALAIEFELEGIPFEREVRVEMFYRGRSIGYGSMDFVVSGELVLELKTVQNLHHGHELQSVMYLKAADHRVGLLINFHSPVLKDGIKRLVN